MVKRSPDGWTLNFLLCNPNERDLDVIAAAERETLEALAEKAPTLTPLGSVAATLVCDLEEVLSQLKSSSPRNVVDECLGKRDLGRGGRRGLFPRRWPTPPRSR